MLTALIDLSSGARTTQQNMSNYFLTPLRMYKKKVAVKSSLTLSRRMHFMSCPSTYLKMMLNSRQSGLQDHRCLSLQPSTAI